ncbi:GGDEF domain-containing protein [Yoonia sp. BS5-3]|uniref:diguanylate cyclase n=1 Tax=Yoonia phaeophyticola TaxID=3137369 RepID=A0ABZ2UZG1_9RHOB
MAQKLLLNLMMPSHRGWQIGQGACLFLLALALVLCIDLIGNWQLSGSALSYALQMPLVVAPVVAIAHVSSVQIRQYKLRLDGVQNRDALTAVYNRAAFTRRVTRVLPQSGALLMLDVDQLKVINRQLGHDTGDLCLMALAMKFRESTRDTDIMGRLDGATFAIYMPGAPMDIAGTIAERLRDGIQVTTAWGLLHVTVSLGAVPADGVTPLDELLHDASNALEQAKLSGRGGVILTDLAAVA